MSLGRLVVCIVVVMFLMSFRVSFASAKTYEIFYVAAIGNDPDAHSSYYVDVKPVYGTDVMDDTENSILRFKLVWHPMDYLSLLAASTNSSDVERQINGLPILSFLWEGDIVMIDYKDCQYTQKSIEKIPATNNYEIMYVGQANFASVNTQAIPEFPEILHLTILAAAIMIITLLLSRKIDRNRARAN